MAETLIKFAYQTVISHHLDFHLLRSEQLPQSLVITYFFIGIFTDLQVSWKSVHFKDTKEHLVKVCKCEKPFAVINTQVDDFKVSFRYLIDAKSSNAFTSTIEADVIITFYFHH